jgi:hypothetical protein
MTMIAEACIGIFTPRERVVKDVQVKISTIS